MGRTVALLICATAIVIALACGGGGTSDGGTPCGPKPAMPSWQPKWAEVDCVAYCNDDNSSSSYQCVNGAWVCPNGLTPITECPCGGGFGVLQPEYCFTCGKTGFTVCDVDAHVMTCPSGGALDAATLVCGDAGSD